MQGATLLMNIVRSKPSQRARQGRMRRATGAMALVLAPFVVHSAPAEATATTAVRISTNASTDTTLGLSIFADANLSAFGTPTGSVTFKAFGPDGTICASPVFTSTVAVSGTVVYSAHFTPSHAGAYRWTSSYSGDATHAAAGPTGCGDLSAAVTVGRATIRLATGAATSTPVAIHATATLTGGFAPTGTITFLLTGPNDMYCSGRPVYTSTGTVRGNATYDSGTYAPARSGDYTWRTTYGGDADNLGASITPCMNAGAVQTVASAPPSGDFAGTGRAQLSLFRPHTGAWFIRDTLGGADKQVFWGQYADVPVPGDYNGDGKTDIAVFRPSTGQWLVKGISDTVYGTSGDIPVPGDYNGDGKTDIAVFRPSQGVWYVLGGATSVWGKTGDIPVPGDYNGDGKTDIAVFRPSQGVWYVRGGATSVWGKTGDIPVPGDYTGDGRTDIAVFRPSDGVWYLQGGATTAWGTSGDQPLELPAAIQRAYFPGQHRVALDNPGMRRRGPAYLRGH